MRFTVVLSLFLLLTGLAGVLPAQNVVDEMEIVRSNFHADKKAVVTLAMELTPQESEAFWPVYNAYQEANKKVNARLIAAVTEFAKANAAVTDEQATRLLKETLAVGSERSALQEKFEKQFSKVLPPAKVLRYFQVENKIFAMLNYAISQEIPLAKASK
jgi:hypothetical protein